MASAKQVIPLLSDKDSKTRLAAVEHLNEVLSSQVNFLDVDTLADNLVFCLKDSNNRIVAPAISCFVTIAPQLPKIAKPQFSLLVNAMISCFGNSRLEIRDGAISAMLVLMQHYPPENIFPLFLTALKLPNPLARHGIVTCVISCLRMFFISTADVFALVLPILIEVLNDKAAEVRDATMSAFEQIYKHTGQDLIDELQRRNMSVSYLKLIFDRLGITDGYTYPESSFLSPNKSFHSSSSSAIRSLQRSASSVTKLKQSEESFSPSLINSKSTPSLERSLQSTNVQTFAKMSPLATSPSTSSIRNSSVGTSIQNETSFTESYNIRDKTIPISVNSKTNLSEEIVDESLSYNTKVEVDPESILFTCVLKPKAIYSERDLETEFAKLAFILKDDRTADWKARVNAMHSLCSFIAGGAEHIANFDSCLLILKEPLVNQLQDLRSAVAKEACATVCYLARALKQNLSWLLMSEDIIVGLFRLIIKAHTTVFVGSSNSTIRCLIRYSHHSKLLPKLFAAAHDRALQLRLRVSEYLLLCINQFDPAVLERFSVGLEDAIDTLLNDKAEETRAVARKCFWAYFNLFEVRAQKLLNNLNPSVRRNIVSNRPSFGNEVRNYFLPTEAPSAILSVSCPQVLADQESTLDKRPQSVTKKFTKASSQSPVEELIEPEVVKINKNATISNKQPVASYASYAATYQNSDDDDDVFMPTVATVSASFDSHIADPSHQLDATGLNAAIQTVRAKSRLLSAPKRVAVAQPVLKKPPSTAPAKTNFNNDDSAESDGSNTNYDYEAAAENTTTESSVGTYVSVPHAKATSFSQLSTLNSSVAIIPELDISLILSKGNNSNWVERLGAITLFESMLLGVFKYKQHVDDCKASNKTWKVDEKAEGAIGKLLSALDKIVTFFEDRVNDKHQKVCLHSLDLMGRFFPLLASPLSKYLDRIIPKLFSRLCDRLENIRTSANSLLNSFCTLYSGTEMYPALLRTLDSQSIKIKDGCLECMLHLGASCQNFFSSPYNMKVVLVKVAPYISDPKYMTLRRVSGLIFKQLLEMQETLFYTQFSLLPSTIQFSVISVLQASCIPDLGRNLLLFQQNGSKFASFSKLMKSSSTGNLPQTSGDNAFSGIEDSESAPLNLKTPSTISIHSTPYQKASRKSDDDFTFISPSGKTFLTPTPIKSTNTTINQASRSANDGNKSLRKSNSEAALQKSEVVLSNTPSRLSFSAIPDLIAGYSVPTVPTVYEQGNYSESVKSSPNNTVKNNIASPVFDTNDVYSPASVITKTETISNDSFSLVSMLEIISTSTDSLKRMASLRKLYSFFLFFILRRLQLLKQDSYHYIFTQNLANILPVIFNCFSESQVQLRDLAMLLLSALSQYFMTELRPFSGLLVDSFLNVCQHDQREVRDAAIDSIMSMVAALDPSICFDRLLPLLTLNKDQSVVPNQTLLRLLSKLIALENSDSLYGRLPNFVKTFSLLIKSENPDVRKNSVFCMVELLKHFGPTVESLLSKSLTVTEMRLVKIYFSKSESK